MSILKAAVHSRTARVGVALSLASAALMGLSASSAEAAALKITPATGAESGGTVVTITGTGFADVDSASLVHAVQFHDAACTTVVGVPAAGTIIAATSTVVASATRLVVVTPDLGAAEKVNVCVYSTATDNPLIGNTTFTGYDAPTVDSLTPAKGSTAGGGTLTITGTNFHKGATVTVGGTALTKVAVASATKITGTLPAHVAGDDLQVEVTSLGGVSADGAGDDFDYVPVVTVSPTSGLYNKAHRITVKGVGFNAIKGNANDGVLFVRGAYNGLDADGAGAGVLKTTPEADACDTVQYVSDKELVCVLNAGNTLPVGAYTITVVGDSTLLAAAGDQTYQSAVTGGATFTVTDM